MRLQSRIVVTVKGRAVGGPAPLICLPLLAPTEAELLGQAEASKRFSPDLLEWRVDGYEGVEDAAGTLGALGRLKRTVGSIPLIFTCRIHAEGGLRHVDREARLDLVTAAARSGMAEIVDVEMCNDAAFVTAVGEAARAGGARLLLSYHNFAETPGEDFLCDKLAEAQERGGDIAKLAVMPRDWGDVLTLLNATLRARTGSVDIPMATLSMGPAGRVTRMAGGLFGSDITFAAGERASAPGQLPIGDLKRVMAILYPGDAAP